MKTKSLRRNSNRTLRLVALCFAVSVLGCGENPPPKKNAKTEASESSFEPTVRTIVSSEELILQLTPQLRALSKGLLDLELPGDKARSLFADEVAVKKELASIEIPDSSNLVATTHIDFKSSDAVYSKTNLSLWQPLLQQMAYLEHGKFYFVSGQLNDELDRFETVVGFAGSGKLKTGKRVAFKGKSTIGWRRQIEDKTKWLIGSWDIDHFKFQATDTPLFVDIMDSAVVDEDTYRVLAKSKHDELIVDLIMGKEVQRPANDLYPFFFSEVTLEHPGVSIVDINEDGFDDVFIAMQHVKNVLLVNQKDGTFKDQTEKFGLGDSGPSTCAVFADFDNDGDQDLFLGAARQRSRYFTFEDGKFVDQTDRLVGPELPYMVSSISAADYNRDGLVDVYFSTYSPNERMQNFSIENIPIWVGTYMSVTELAGFEKRLGDFHEFLDRPGPPNVLLRNKGGGRFSLAEENEQLQIWQKTFQATWTDFDDDGDPDVYLANDFGPDRMMRNDFPNGFVEITEEVGLQAMGFAMGASWADYDNDGQSDLYVSNMFSKAGQRITRQVAGLDARFAEMAEGNFLFKKSAGKLNLVSGNEPEKLHVNKAGWSWGGQFADFDNDGFQDLYVASGFYTAPADVAVDVDL